MPHCERGVAVIALSWCHHYLHHFVVRSLIRGPLEGALLKGAGSNSILLGFLLLFGVFITVFVNGELVLPLTRVQIEKPLFKKPLLPVPNT